MAFTPEEESQQLTVLQEVRNRHHLKLVYEGVAQRIIDAEVPANYMGDTRPIAESTLLFAGREKLGAMAIGRLWGGGETIAGSCSLIEDIFVFAREYPDSDVIVMNRLDARADGGYSQSYHTAGIRRNGSEEQNDKLFPLDGIRVEDLSTLTDMVSELEGLRVSGDLSCLSEEGLINVTIYRHGPVPLP